MPEEILIREQSLPWILLYSAPLVVLFAALDRGQLDPVRFRAPAGPREPPLWGLAEVLMAFAAWLISQIAAGALASDEGLPVRVFVGTLVSTAVVVLVIIYFVHFQLGQPLSTLGLNRSPIVNVVPVAAVYALLFVPISAVAGLWQVALYHLGGAEAEPQFVVKLFKSAVAGGAVDSIAPIVFSTVILAPIGEELLCRGLLYGWLKTRWGKGAGAFLSALLFAGLHQSLGAVAPIFVLGLVLVYVYERTGSLHYSILFHAIFNGVNLALMSLGSVR
jgi:membrane protease YdiL (CAAX protease family)